MQLQFLGHGFEQESKHSVGNKLIELFSDTNFHSFTGISAFSSESGINGIANFILEAKHLKNVTIITGIDQKGTSKEALEALMKLNISSFIFYQPSFSIFHPKIYLFEGEERSDIIIGSSNLTTQGLFINVESSIYLSFDNKSDFGPDVIGQVKSYFGSILDKSDLNLKEITIQLIAELVKAKIVPTEDERKALQNNVKQDLTKGIDDFILKVFPKRTIPKIPKEFRRNTLPRKKLKEEVAAPVESDTENTVLFLLWQSGPLTERDLNIPKGENTNPTGSMLFKKGKALDIDQRHYFRNSVFPSLKWSKDYKKEHLERAIATFEIIIDNTNYGNFNLTLTHNTNINSKTYIQANSMTHISWGEAKKLVAKEELLGQSLYLYATQESDKFVIKITK